MKKIGFVLCYGMESELRTRENSGQNFRLGAEKVVGAFLVVSCCTTDISVLYCVTALSQKLCRLLTLTNGRATSLPNRDMVALTDKQTSHSFTLEFIDDTLRRITMTNSWQSISNLL